MSVTVLNWRYFDGYNHSTFEPVKSKQDDIVGWHCMVVVDSDNYEEFNSWLFRNCPTTQYHGYHSDTVKYILHITDQAEAAHFSLKWL